MRTSCAGRAIPCVVGVDTGGRGGLLIWTPGTTVEFVSLPATSTATARRSYEALASVLVSKGSAYGATRSVPIGVHAFEPAAARSKRTREMPEPFVPSSAVASSVIRPWSGDAPGDWRV